MSAVPRTLAWGAGAGLIGVGVALLPPVLIGVQGIRLSEYLASATLIMVGWLSQRGSSLGVAGRLLRALFVPALASTMLGFAMAAYLADHPQLLEARYATLLASSSPSATADLVRHRARFVSAGYCAANMAATAFFWGFLVAGFIAFRDRMARRRAAAR